MWTRSNVRTSSGVRRACRGARQLLRHVVHGLVQHVHGPGRDGIETVGFPTDGDGRDAEHGHRRQHEDDDDEDHGARG